jgi:TolB-like protein/DNA-binding winged helix-turn-helix (wHTH) protein/Tfp pilus assembly protein PilF
LKRSPGQPHIRRFDVFEVNLRSGELCQPGSRIRLQDQPLQILELLLDHPGEVVTREQLKNQLWPDDVVVDFDHSINSAVKRLRNVLGDDAENPRYIETLPRHGYRFIGAVDYGTAKQDRHKGRAPGAPREARRWLASAAIIVVAAIVLFGTLFALNVGGLRDRLLGPGAPPKIESIAVLPFENLSGDLNQEYFADGMTEELITNLGKISALDVISRTSVMRYKGTRKPLPEIARELNVDTIVESAVRSSGGRVRITVQLIDARTDHHLWAQSYERNMGDVLAMQRDIALAIAREVQAELTPQEQTRFARDRPVKPEAYELYLRGRYEWNKRTTDGLYKALEYFQRAVRVDPRYSLAYSGLADSYSILGNNAFLPGAEVYPRAKTAALRALELDNELAEAHTSLALVLFDYDRDRKAALKELKAAIALNPNYATARHWYANMLAAMGQFQEAIPEIELARKLDPLSARTNANVGYVLYFARQYDRAISEARKAVELDPNDRHSHTALGFMYLQKGMNREALDEFQKSASLPTGPRFGLGILAFGYAAVGNRGEALKALRKAKQLWKAEYVSPYRIATIYVALGERDEAFKWLEKGVAEYDGQMDYLEMDPIMDPLRSDPRFQDILRRMNFAP